VTSSRSIALEIGDSDMKVKSVSGITCYVKNLKKTVSFYEALGFETKKQDVNHATLYSNWFWIDFLAIAKNERAEFTRNADLSKKGEGVYLYLSVDDVDMFHKFLQSKKHKPSTRPQDQPWGNREFILRDPDGYKLVIFKRK
jgi:catechol 2,3-dioxygenase-like lactoylglutathione lyase family enzyme